MFIYLQVRRNSIAKSLSQNQPTITPYAFKLSAKLFEFPLINAHNFFVEKSSQANINDKMKTGFAKFLKCLRLYQESFNITFTNNNKITIYGSVTLENGAIVRAISSFHNRPWFSNVSVRMDSEELFNYTSDKGGICYGQVIIV